MVEVAHIQYPKLHSEAVDQPRVSYQGKMEGVRCQGSASDYRLDIPMPILYQAVTGVLII